MTHDSAINKELDKAVSTRSLDAETRNLCYRLLREGTEAQVLRAFAVLRCLGDSTPDFPSSIAAGIWPTLPSKEAELRAIYSLVKQDPSLSRSFVTALLSKPGPSDKVRQQLFWDFVEQQGGDHPVIRFVSAMRALGQRLNQDNSASAVRVRLIGYATKILKTHRRGIDAEGIRLIFSALASLYESSSLHGEHEAAQLVNFLLTQASGGHATARINSLREGMNPFLSLAPFLRLGWTAPKLKKADLLKRVQTTDDAVVYASSADTGADLDFFRTLLSIVLPANTPLDEWLSNARARLAQLQPLPKASEHVSSLLHAVHETGLFQDVTYASVQDTPAQAAAALRNVVRKLAGEIKRLTHENNYLRSPDAVRKLAGTLIDEELKRQGDVLGQFQEHAKQRRKELAERLRPVLRGLRAGDGTLSAEFEGVVLDVIAFLEGRS